jgi:SAM-dependent methyltransferase
MSESIQQIRSKGGRTNIQLIEMSLFRVNKVSQGNMDRKLLSYYNQEAKRLCTKYESADMSQIHAWLLEIIPSDSSILELGCGSGREAAFLHSKGYRVLATDGSEGILREAISFHPELKGVISRLTIPAAFPFRDASFESVLAIGVLMHLQEKDIQLTVDEVSRVLTASGRFVFSVPGSRDDLDANGRDEGGRQYTFLDESHWTELLGAAGLEIIKRRESQDSLGRAGITWIAYLAKKGNQ